MYSTVAYSNCLVLNLFFLLIVYSLEVLFRSYVYNAQEDSTIDLKMAFKFKFPSIQYMVRMEITMAYMKTLLEGTSNIYVISDPKVNMDGSFKSPSEDLTKS